MTFKTFLLHQKTLIYYRCIETLLVNLSFSTEKPAASASKTGMSILKV